MRRQELYQDQIEQSRILSFKANHEAFRLLGVWDVDFVDFVRGGGLAAVSGGFDCEALRGIGRLRVVFAGFFVRLTISGHTGIVLYQFRLLFALSIFSIAN